MRPALRKGVSFPLWPQSCQYPHGIGRFAQYTITKGEAVNDGRCLEDSYLTLFRPRGPRSSHRKQRCRLAELSVEAYRSRIVEFRTAMKEFRSACSRLCRVLLVSALATSTIAASTAGEALVVHRHGHQRVHWHVLASAEVRSNAAWSSRLGHIPNSDPIVQLTSEQVRIIAFVATGSVFVSKRQGAAVAEEGRLAPLDFTPFLVSELQKLTAIINWLFTFPMRIGRTTTATILLRNHAILI